MTATTERVRPPEQERSGAHLAFTASVVISAIGWFVSLVGRVWANVQRVDYDDLDAHRRVQR